MEKKSILVVAILALAALVVIGVMNRVALRALHVQAMEGTRALAEAQVIENWEVFFRQALADLGREIKTQEAGLHELLLRSARDRARLTREEELLAKYEKALREFSNRLNEAGNGPIQAFGRSYTPDAAQVQLREFAAAVVDQQAKASALQESTSRLETQNTEIANALRIAREQMASLQQKGEHVVREKSLAELKSMAVEISSAVVGLEPNAPLSGAMNKINDLLMRIQEQTDTVSAPVDIRLAGTEGTGRIMTIQQALQQLDYSRREQAIDGVLRSVSSDTE